MKNLAISGGLVRRTIVRAEGGGGGTASQHDRKQNKGKTVFPDAHARLLRDRVTEFPFKPAVLRRLLRHRSTDAVPVRTFHLTHEIEVEITWLDVLTGGKRL